MSRKLINAAIYTRKSSEEGLEQSFNSLDAQRGAGEAYIASQQHEGWELIPDHFDDGGYSGGTLDRPALQRLLDKVCAGEIDVIVVYKIDRLTRSLMDFAQLAELFEQHQVSFVSVTQSIDTGDSMGRLMLNVLLSFAQFERELTGECIRDKIAASKKLGLWMGGSIPMGYDVQDRELVINRADADNVQRIFDLYLEEGSVAPLVDRLKREGIKTAERVSTKGKRSGGLTFTRGHLYRILQNPVYIGRIPHKDTSYKGKHKPIINQETWQKVQDQLEANAQGGRTRRSRADHPSLLAGLLTDTDARPMKVDHAQKGSTRYRYYVAASDEKPLRLPAPEMESAVLQALRSYLTDSARLLPDLGALDPREIPTAIGAANTLADQLHQPLDPEHLETFGVLVTAVTYHPDHLDLALDRSGLRSALGLSKAADDDVEPILLRAPLNMRRRGVQTKMVLGDRPVDREPDQALVTAVARGHVWAQQLINGEVATIGEIAKAEGLTVSYVGHVVRLGFLAPDLVEAVLQGTQPQDLTADALIHDAGLALGWAEQVGR